MIYEKHSFRRGLGSRVERANKTEISWILLFPKPKPQTLLQLRSWQDSQAKADRFLSDKSPFNFERYEFFWDVCIPYRKLA